MAKWPRPDDDKDGDAPPSLPLINLTGKGEGASTRKMRRAPPAPRSGSVCV